MALRTRFMLAGGTMAAAMLAAPAMADFTNIQSAPSGESHLWSIIETTYGATNITQAHLNAGFFSYTDANNDTVTVTRVHDYTGASSASGNTSLHSPYNNTLDQTWTDGLSSFQFHVKHAGNNNVFGWNDGTNFHEVVRVTGAAPGTANPSATGTVTFTSPFTWQLNSYNTTIPTSGPIGPTPLNTWSSVQGNNTGGNDHFVAFFIERTGYDPVWLIAAEDLTTGQSGADWDYNDMVIEFSMSIIPLPNAATASLAGLLALGGVRVVRRRRTN